jgi:rRNA-processing protein FCF1
MESEKLIIFFDTNILYVSGDKGEDFSEFSLNTVYIGLADFIERNDFEGVKIFIPKIVLEELSFQKRKRYPESLKTLKNHFKNFDKLPGFILQAPEDFDYNPYLHQRIEEYIAKMGIDILPYPSNERFNNLIQRAVEKRPPFKGKDTISDKGFKDAINWESILEFVRSHECENYILYSKDQDFSEEL